MFDFLGAMICRFKGHKWGHARVILTSLGDHNEAIKVKHCLRCYEAREVKTRAKKA